MFINYKQALLSLLVLCFASSAFSQIEVLRRGSDRTYTFNVTNDQDDSTLTEIFGSKISLKYQPILPYQQLHAKVLTSAESALLNVGIYAIDTTVVVDGSVTIPDGVFFLLTSDSTINVPDAADTLWLPPNSIIANPERHVFYGSGQIRMPGSHIHAKWFGATGDGVTEDHIAIQWAADALRGEGSANVSLGSWGTLEFPEGKFIVNPTNHLTFLPDSGRTLYIIGQGEGTVITNRDFAAYGDLFGDAIVTGNAHQQGHVWFRDFVIDSTHRGDSDGTGGVNGFGIVRSESTIENVIIKWAGNRAIAYEGEETSYTYPGNGFRNVTIKNVIIENAWKNAVSINKHNFTNIQFVRIDGLYIDGFSRIVPDSAGQGNGFASSGINILARDAAYNPGHDFYLNNINIKNGYAASLEINGLLENNDFILTNSIFENTNVDSATTPAAVLITNAVGGFVNNLKIRKTVGGSAWRDRTGNGRWNITNLLIDSTQSGTSPGYAMDLFGTSGYMISNSRFLDNARGFFANNSGEHPWGWITNSHIRGDSLGYYIYEFNLEDVFSLTGSKIEYTQDIYTATGLNIVYNGYFAADSHNVKDFDSNGIPDGWEIYFPYNEVYRDSLITYLDADSGLVIENQASQQLDFVLRQNVSARLSGSNTYTLNMMTLDDNGGNTLRQWVNAGAVGGAVTTGTYQQTGQSVTSYIGVGRAGATKMAANSRLVVKWIECLVE